MVHLSRVYPESQCGFRLQSYQVKNYDILCKAASGNVQRTRSTAVHCLYRPNQGEFYKLLFLKKNYQKYSLFIFHWGLAALQTGQVQQHSLVELKSF